MASGPRRCRAWRSSLGAAALVVAASSATAQPSGPPALGLSPITSESSSLEPKDGSAPLALHVDCRGDRSDKPTVVFEAGAFGSSADWDLVLQDLAADGRVCAYDRAGMGASPAGDHEPKVRLIAQDLHAVLDAIGEPSPVILVGHSNGALYVEAFARLWPERVAGIAYVNGVVSDALLSPRLMSDLKREERMARLAYVGGRLHLAGLVAGSRVRAMGLTGEAAQRKLRGLNSAAMLKAGRDEDRRITLDLAEVATLPPLTARIPIAVLVSASRPPSALDAAWRDSAAAPAGRSCRSWVLDLPGGTHVSPLGRDRIYVVVAVRWLQREALSAPPEGCTPTAPAATDASAAQAH